MLRRLGWIAASYFTRPLILTLVAFGLLFLVVTSFDLQFNPRFGTVYPSPPMPRLMVNSTAALESVRREGKQAEVGAIDLNALWTDMHRPRKPSKDPQLKVIAYYKPPDDAFYDVLAEFPNLRFVHADFAGSDVGTKQVAAVRNLEYLFVDGAPPTDFAWMRSLEKLRWLQLGVYSPPKGLSSLDALEKLETIVFRHPFEVNDDVLEALAGLPHLKLLVLDFGYSRLGKDYMFSETGLSALARSRSLETLYAGGEAPADRAQLLRMARRALPRLDVKAAVSSAMPIVLLRMVPFGCFAAAIGLALSAQFRLPQARLAPQFVASHALVAGLFFVATVAGGAAALATKGNNPLAAAVVCAALAAAIISQMSVDLQNPPADRRLRVRFVEGLRMAMYLTVLILLFLPQYTGAILSGQRPWLLVAGGLIAVVALVITAWSLRRIMAPATVSFIDRQSFRRRMLWQSQLGSGWMFGLSRAERTIDAWSGRRDWTWWQRVGRWRLGNAPFRSERYMLLMFVGFAVVVPIYLSAFGQPSTAVNMRGSMLLLFGIMVLAGPMGQVTNAWRARMLILPLEVLRPYSRRALQTELATAFVLDMLRPAMLLAALAAVGINFDPDWHLNWARLPLDFSVSAVVMLCITVGLGSVLVVVKRDWLLVVIILGAFVLTVFPVVGLLAWQFPQFLSSTQLARGLLTPGVFMAQLWPPVVVGAGLAWAMWRRWLTMEIGSRV